MNEIHKMELNFNIKKISFAPNNKYLAILEENSKTIKIIKLGKLTNNSENLMNSQNKEIQFEISQAKIIENFFIRRKIILQIYGFLKQ